MPEFGCCTHCKYDADRGEHDPPHGTPCDHGCNDHELEAMQDA
jgi:hypothetical protein